jgi:hypothetical protein
MPPWFIDQGKWSRVRHQGAQIGAASLVHLYQGFTWVYYLKDMLQHVRVLSA